MGPEAPFQVVGNPLFGENDADVWKKFRKKAKKPTRCAPRFGRRKGGDFFFG